MSSRQPTRDHHSGERTASCSTFSPAPVWSARQSAADEDPYDFNPVDLEQAVQSRMTPLTRFGSAIVASVEDLQSQTRIKLQRARQAVAATLDLKLNAGTSSRAQLAAQILRTTPATTFYRGAPLPER